MSVFVLVVLCIVDLFFLFKTIVHINEDETMFLPSFIMFILITLAVIFQSISL
jgi:hypothetical protein